MRPLRHSALLCLLAVTFAACPTRIPRPANALVDADEILGKANARMASAESLAVYARVWQGDVLMTAPVRMELVVSRPDKLYFAIVDPTGNMLGSLASDGKNFTSFQRGQDTCLTGPACATNVGRLLPITMPPKAIADVLMGGAPTINAVSKRVNWDERAGAYCIVLTAADKTVQEVWVTHGTWLTRRSRVTNAKGEVVLDLKFSDEKRVGGLLVAHEINLRVPKTKAKQVRIQYREVDLNEPLDDDAFQLTCPKGASPRFLPCPADEVAPKSAAPEPVAPPAPDANDGGAPSAPVSGDETGGSS